MNLLKGSLFLKLAALAAALLTYFYIHNEIENAERRETRDPSYKLIKLTAKKLPVNARLATSAPEGYRIVEGKVATNPAEIVVVGPEALLEGAVSAQTALIDVSESTKTVVKKIPIETVAGVPLAGEPYLVETTVPIEEVKPASETPNKSDK
ncbi:MAG: YbbR-like domain-containing protein [Candidatus Omnitrophica bacterium]|nr:YbbR-like domain-containing protein [Candidatus Omnitrophota bacterium]